MSADGNALSFEDLNQLLRARPVSAWNARKHHFLRKYMHIFSVGMKRYPGDLTYVDLFAGPGMCLHEDTGRREDGSPLIALAQPFVRYAFVEYDVDDADALRRRVAAHKNGSRAKVFVRDCNAAIDDVRTQMPKGGLTFAFIDPTAWQIRFESIRGLVDKRKVDLMITFHVMGMRRNADREMKIIDDFFGTKDWRPIVGKQKLRAGDLLDVYRRQLAAIGYVFDAAAPAVRVENSMGAPIYYLLFASKNPKGYEFWRKIVAEEETGQRRLLGTEE